jgi:integrase
MDGLFGGCLERETVGLENFRPKTPASAKPVPVIRRLAEILDAYRSSMGNPQSGVMFHSGAGQHMDFDKLARRVRPVVASLKIDWYGWHGFRLGIASNLYELGADEKIVQRILRHAKSHVTKDRHIKAFDPAVVAAMKKLEATVDLVNQSAPNLVGQCAKMLKSNRGEVAERLKAAVC